MTYGMRRWAMGYWCGMALASAIWLFSVEHWGWPVLAGLAIVTFFADVVIYSDSPSEWYRRQAEKRK